MLEGKVVAVTGAGRGIGRAIALQCAALGAHVVVNDAGLTLNGQDDASAPAKQVVDEVQKAGGSAIANSARIDDPADAKTIIDDALSVYGRIDAVVNNAGILRDAPFDEMTPADWNAVVNVHLNGYFYVANAAAPHFKAQGSGAYVHFTSPSGLTGSRMHANYAAAKLGVVGLSTSIALEMGRFGVRSNCVAPFAWTRMVEASVLHLGDQTLIDRMRLVTPEQVAPLVALLCSDAALGINGQVLGVRRNEVFVFNRPQVVRSAHNSEGWTAEKMRDQLLPMLAPSLQPVVSARDVFSWDPL